jgi:hypothetical protein
MKLLSDNTLTEINRTYAVISTDAAGLMGVPAVKAENMVYPLMVFSERSIDHKFIRKPCVKWLVSGLSPARKSAGRGFSYSPIQERF